MKFFTSFLVVVSLLTVGCDVTIHREVQASVSPVSMKVEKVSLPSTPPLQRKVKPEGMVSFHDFRMGMTRKEVQDLVLSWKIVQHKDNICTNLPGRSYLGISSFIVLFSDSCNLLPDQERIGTITRWIPFQEQAEKSRLTDFGFAFSEQKGDPQVIIDACISKFGDITTRNARKTTEPWGFVFNLNTGPVSATNESYVWEDMTNDHTVILQIERYGKSMLAGEQNSFTASLFFHDRVKMRTFINTVLEDEILFAAQHEVHKVAANAIAPIVSVPERDSLYFKIVGDSRKISGKWWITLRYDGENYIEREGLLDLAPDDDNKVSGTVEWLKGNSLGSEKVVGELREVRPQFPASAVILRTQRTSLLYGEVPDSSIYVAALEPDSNAMSLGKSSVSRLVWTASRISEPEAGPQLPVEGNWISRAWRKGSEKLEKSSDSTISISSSDRFGRFRRLVGQRHSRDEKPTKVFGYIDDKEKLVWLGSYGLPRNPAEPAPSPLQMRGRVLKDGNILGTIGYSPLTSKMEIWAAFR